MSGASTRPAATAVEPLSTRRCHGAASAKSHCTVSGPAGAVRKSTPRRTVSNSSAIVSGSRAGGPFFSPRIPACSSAIPRSARSRGGRSIG